MATGARSKKQSRSSLKTVTKRKGRPQTNSNSLANLKPFEPGKSGNPGGRPKLLGESYKQWLEKYNESVQMTNAEAVASAMGLQALRGDVGAAREIRSATEGDRVVFEDAWKREVIELLKAGQISPQDVVEALGIDDARGILIAAGAAVPAGASEQQKEIGADHSAAA